MSDWQTGVPPVTGWYDVIWGDTPTDDAEAWGDEERTATWRLRSPAAMPGLPLREGAIGWRYVYRG